MQCTQLYRLWLTGPCSLSSCKRLVLKIIERQKEKRLASTRPPAEGAETPWDVTVAPQLLMCPSGHASVPCLHLGPLWGTQEWAVHGESCATAQISWEKVNPYFQPSIISFSPGGTSYKRHKCYRLPGWCLDHRHPSEKVAYSDYLSERVQGTMCHLERQEKSLSI